MFKVGDRVEVVGKSGLALHGCKGKVAHRDEYQNGYGVAVCDVKFDHLPHVITIRASLIKLLIYAADPNPTGPVRTITETRTYVEPGQYGRLEIPEPVSANGDTIIRIGFDSGYCVWMEAHELREAAATMIQLASFLESKSDDIPL